MWKRIFEKIEKLDKKRLRTALWVLLAAYAFVLLYMTVLKRKPFEGRHLELRLFWSYKVPKEYKQIIGNIVVFIPFGFLFGLLSGSCWQTLAAGGLFSAIIEVLQLVFKLGLCELDDVFHNLLGTAIGFFLILCIRNKLKKASNEKDILSKW